MLLFSRGSLIQMPNGVFNKPYPVYEVNFEPIQMLEPKIIFSCFKESIFAGHHHFEMFVFKTNFWCKMEKTSRAGATWGSEEKERKVSFQKQNSSF